MSKETVINNYSIDVRSLLEEVSSRERTNIIETLVEAKALIRDGESLHAVVYDNWSEREEEGHNPQFRIITFNGKNDSPEQVQEETAESEAN